MQELDLRKIPSFWMTCEKNMSRWITVNSILEETEIPAQKICGEITNPYTIGVSASFLKVLKENNPPILFLEDDIGLTPDFQPVIPIPNGDIDAIYIGTTQHGRVNKVTYFEGVACVSYDENYVKIENMLSLHAFVVLSERYRNHLIDLYTDYDPNNGTSDDVVADTMKNWNVLAVRKPFFFQNDGHHNKYTLEPIKPFF